MLQLLDGARQSVRRRAAGDVLGKEGPSQISDTHPSVAAAPSLVNQETLGKLVSSKEDSQNTSQRNILNARDNPKEFSRHYLYVIKRFIMDKAKYELELPNLDGYDRLVVHAIAEKCNLSHRSEGVETRRLLRLKKDELFFQKPEAVEEIDLEDIIRKVGEKESKYHLRRVVVSHAPAGDAGGSGRALRGSSSSGKTANQDYRRRGGVAIRTVQIGQVGSYGDEEALAKIERFRRATDDYLYATDMGYSTEELLLQQENGNASEHRNVLVGDGQTGKKSAGVTFEDRSGMWWEGESNKEEEPASGMKRRLVDMAASVNAAESGKSSSNSGHTGSVPIASSHPSLHPASGSPSLKEKSFMEVCTGCWSRVPVIIPVHQWRCEKFCGACSCTAIWRLEELNVSFQERSSSSPSKGPLSPSTGPSHDWGFHMQRDVQSQATSPIRETSHKRHKGMIVEEEVVAYSSSTPYHGSSDDMMYMEEEEKEGDPLLLSDVMEFLAMNDFSVDDAQWIQNFATSAIRIEQEDIARMCSSGMEKSLLLPTTSLDNDNLRLRDYLTFCIDFSDVLHLHFFKRYEFLKAFFFQLEGRETEENARRKKSRIEGEDSTLHCGDVNYVYVVIRAHQAIEKSLSFLLQEVLKSAFPNDKSVEGEQKGEFLIDEFFLHMGLAIPNVSVYGVEATAICQLRTVPQYLLSIIKKVLAASNNVKQSLPDKTSAFKRIHMEGLQLLQKEYGEDHIFFTESLETAVEKGVCEVL